MRQPEEIRLGTVGRDVLPAVVLYDEEDELIVAEGTPSPAAWQPAATEPVLAWQDAGTAKDARVYAEMASLVAASGELLADEPEPLGQAPDRPPGGRTDGRPQPGLRRPGRPVGLAGSGSGGGLRRARGRRPPSSTPDRSTTTNR